MSQYKSVKITGTLGPLSAMIRNMNNRFPSCSEPERKKGMWK